MKFLLLFLLSFLILVACSPAQDSTQAADNQLVILSSLKSDTTVNRYHWLSKYDISEALVNRIEPPQGFKRVGAEVGSFADWLRHLPLKPAGSKVFYYNNQPKKHDVHVAVVKMDVGKRDLQQCADAVMRLIAEYHYSQKNYKKIHFNFTSGDRVSFDDWRQGRKPSVKGNRVVFSQKTTHFDDSYSNFRAYLDMVFSYAGTASLSKELEVVSLEMMQIGDIFIKGGFPGHAVLVVDMAENAVGEKVFLLAQSYMPAQEMHVLQNPNRPDWNGWYSLSFGNILQTPEWTFSGDELKRRRN